MKKSVTAAELLAQLNADPAYAARRKARDEARQLKEQEYAAAEAVLVGELRSAGAPVESVWDIVNGNVKSALHAELLPILLTHMKRSYPDAILDGIARALAIPAARFAWPVIVTLYREAQGQRVKQGLAVAIANIVDDETIDDLIRLAQNPTHGESRILLLEALGRIGGAGARKALMQLGTDPELQKESQRILRRMKKTRV